MMNKEPPDKLRNFTIGFLHKSNTLHVALDTVQLTWFVEGHSSEIHQSHYRLLGLAEDLWLLVLNKTLKERPYRTFQFLSPESGAAFEATASLNPPFAWTYDRGRIGRSPGFGTPFIYPRREPPKNMTSEHPRCFEATLNTLILTTVSRGTCSLAVIDADPTTPIFREDLSASQSPSAI